jgi:hypothetical protein
MSLSPPSTFLCVAGSCTVVDKNSHTIGARQLGSLKSENSQDYGHENCIGVADKAVLQKVDKYPGQNDCKKQKNKNTITPPKRPENTARTCRLRKTPQL